MAQNELVRILEVPRSIEHELTRYTDSALVALFRREIARRVGSRIETPGTLIDEKALIRLRETLASCPE